MEMESSNRHDKKRATMIANLEAATGWTIQAWVAEVNRSELDGFTAIVNWLKRSHGLGHFQARLVAQAHRDQ
jgi:hypothetical protein